ncbi:condensation domain-containing protein [Labedaea rhizosphaerae]|uniref:Condensation domain-containing protein n=1 Tax=Labedaea rhizosphaerae TaxID=598644 RepID=A0A4R6SET8_LABRH|nr:condensation domain-containing protein [Labedaea rhizosphaerae]TDQ00462.1 condensation domain-containing protein [Labedaea rhizosphaerae]
MTDDVPLSYGQLYSWREIETYPAAWRQEANIPATWDLRGIPVERVEQALRLLVERHEPLRTSYHVHDGVPAQRRHERIDLPITRTEKVITDYQEPERMTGELAATPIPMTGGLCWRGELVTMYGEPMFLSLAFSHLILDIWSTLELERQFFALAADPAAELPPTVSPRELMCGQVEAAWAGRDRPAERHWGKFVGTELPTALPTLPSGGTAERVQVTLHSRELTDLADKAAAAQGVTAPAVLLSLIAAGLARHLRTERVVLNLMASNRFAPELRQTVGTLNQLVPVLLDTDPRTTLADHVRAAHWAAVKAYRYASYDTDKVTGMAAERLGDSAAAASHDCWFNHLYPCWFNYLDLGGDAADAEPGPASLQWAPRARQYGQPFDTRITVHNRQTQLQLRADPRVLDAEALIDVLRTVVHGMVLTSANKDVTLGALPALPHDDLPDTLFPHDVPAPPLLAA